MLAPVLAAEPIPVVPVSMWEKGEDGCRLEARDGVLAIHYDVEVKTSRRIQQKTVFEEARAIRLAKPVPVRPEYERVFFDARGQDGSAETRDGTVFLRPVLRDSRGELFSYEPYRVDSVKTGEADDWTAWTTRPFLTSEAGGASPNIYEASGGDENAWPDGPLQLVGFELRMRANQSGSQGGHKQGTLYLADVRLAGLDAEVAEPVAFLDAFVKEKGEYQAVYEVRPGFQALPIAEGRARFSYDPASETSRRQLIPFNHTNGRANSWIAYRFTDAGGKIAAKGSVRWERNRPPREDEPVNPVDISHPPALGLVRVNPERFTDGVYPPGVPLEAVLRVFGTGDGGDGGDGEGDDIAATLRWEWQTYAFAESLGKGEETLSTGHAKAFEEIRVKLDPPPGQNAFRLLYTVQDRDGREIDRGTYLLGRGGKVEASRSRTGLLPDRRRIKAKPYHRITFHNGHGKESSADHLRKFEQTLEEAGELTGHITYMIDLADFEVLPGVYDFRMLDRIMDAAADRRFGVTVRLAHAETKSPYLWLPYTKVRDFDGSVIGGHPVYKAVSMAGGTYMDVWVRAFRALNERYREHPGFEGYYLMMPNGEWVLPEEIWHGKIADYSWEAREAFRRYLQAQGDLDALNRRWGTAYREWREVPLPLPDWSLGTAPDLRPEWADFNRFKLKLRDHWCRELGRRIREFDSDRVIISYGSPVDLILDDGSRPIDYAHNGGNQFLRDEGRYVRAWDDGKGVGWITEPHHPHRWAAYGDPGDLGRVLDWSVFVMLAQAGGGGANLHVYYYPNPTYDLVAHYGGEYALDRFQALAPVLRELHEMRIVTVPKQVAAFNDPTTLFAKHRTTFKGRANDLNRWFELLTADSVPWEFFVPENEAAYRVVFLNPMNEVVSGDSLETLERYTRGGGTLVLSANAGRYNADEPKTEFALLRRLGIAPPTGPFRRDGEGTKAVVEPALVEKLGGRREVPFYSQAAMRREIRDPQIGADFNRWPYRWLPQSDYFGIYPGQKVESGAEVIARFSDGGVAISRHRVGKGSAWVFWGTPDMTPERLGGMLGRIAALSGAENPQAGNAIPYMLEGRHRSLNRHYALLYHDTPGTYRQKLPNTPDGEWFVDDLISTQRLGTFSGRKLREEGIEVTFYPGISPLKVLRLDQPKAPARPKWHSRYPDLTGKTDDTPDSHE